MTQPCPTPLLYETKIKIRMKEFGETRQQAEAILEWIETTFDEHTMRTEFRKILNGYLFK